ncbi:efflux RND transporter periplasmic adaptor subunit [Labrenzia sp. CE80]|uniref:efflux RND transporter periplasmic adaptor subunit n=1 Tax=Labrenzia sp. CE80 TaxID=1788986 RepID=UPI00129BA294|nr:efflux RND transporter periplasmic adaptor subunit [Labrenzia sp. CE80]
MLFQTNPKHLARFLILSGAAVVLVGCNDKSEKAAAPPPPSVTVAGVQSKDIRQSESFVGSIAAVDQVGLVARVSGFLEEQLVKDGAIVKKGDLIFKIEKQQYEAALQSANADLASAKADAALKSANEKRDKDLVDKGHVSEAAYEATLAQKQQAEASVLAAQAAISQAELDLSYTDVKAPFDGQIGKATYSVGEVVGPTADPLGNLIRLAPVYVNFSVSEAQYLNAVKTHGINPVDIPADKSPSIKLVLPNGQDYDETGKIVYIDNAIDPSTGTISFRGQFTNKDLRLLAGTYVTVILEAPVEETVLVVPQAAIQRDQQGDFALEVTSDNKVQQVYLDLGKQVETDFVVNKGLDEGAQVIVEGLQKVRPGVEVKPVQSSKTAEKN